MTFLMCEKVKKRFLWGTRKKWIQRAQSFANKGVENQTKSGSRKFRHTKRRTEKIPGNSTERENQKSEGLYSEEGPGWGGMGWGCTGGGGAVFVTKSYTKNGWKLQH